MRMAMAVPMLLQNIRSTLDRFLSPAYLQTFGDN